MRHPYPGIYRFVDRFPVLFGWLRWFYPKSVGIHPSYLLYFFLPQKLMRINGRVPWPVHFTSRILFWKNISVGNRSAPGMNAGAYVQARNGIQIGHNLRMGPGVGLISANHLPGDYDQHTTDAPIQIGDNVWIGMNTVILPGVCIGDNVIVGANAVVNSDLPANVLAAGNPCRVISEKAPYQGKDYAGL